MWVGDMSTQEEETELPRWVLLAGARGCVEPLGKELAHLGWPTQVIPAPLRGVDAHGASVVCIRMDGEHNRDLRLLRELREETPTVPVILFGPKLPSDAVQERWRAGAFDVVMRQGCPTQDLVSVLERAHAHHNDLMRRARQQTNALGDARRTVQIQRLELRHLRRRATAAEARLLVAEELTEALQAPPPVIPEAQEEPNTQDLSGLFGQIAQGTEEPLQRILAAVDRLLDGQLDREACEQALAICGAARSLSAVVRELGHLERGAGDMEPDLVEFLSRISAIRRATGVELSLRVHTPVEDGTGWLHLQASDEGGSVRVHMGPERDPPRLSHEHGPPTLVPIEARSTGPAPDAVPQNGPSQGQSRHGEGHEPERFEDPGHVGAMTSAQAGAAANQSFAMKSG